MAHFAKLGANSKVIQVLTLNNGDMLNADGVEDETVGQQYLETHNNWPAQMWIQTSYNTGSNQHKEGGTPLRGNYAGVGWHYLEDEDVFLPPRRYDYYVADLENYVWKPPIDKPDDQNYYWDDNAYLLDNTTGWVLIPEPEE